MKKHLFHRLLSLVLVAVMVLGLAPAANAAPGLRWKKSDVDVSWDMTDRLTGDEIHQQTAHKPTEMVRVSIVLEDAPTAAAGYATQGIGANAAARAYDRNLKKVQDNLASVISTQALGGRKLDVVWNLTLVSNLISANVPYGKIDAIKAVEGVKDVVLENRYEAQTAAAAPEMYSSSGMVGGNAVWASGMTGAGTRVAIIDTGTDTDHQSFDNDAFLFALAENAAGKGMSSDEYIASLNLLGTEEISAVLEQLNAFERIGVDAVSDYYLSEKLPFAANYVDRNLVVDHDSDQQGSHGSHVAGIAAANRYIEQNGKFVSARDTVRMNGIAPDAQIITMKVFGNAPGPYDSDYFAAIEDAIWLGCDSVNLSLGGGAPGYSRNKTFSELLDFLATTDTVVVMSAGNSGHWAENTTSTYLYNDGVSFQTDGSPGSYTNSLAVASVDNDGTVGKYIEVGGRTIIYTESEYKNRPIASLDTTAGGSGTEYPYIFIDGLGKTEDYAGMDLNGKVVFCHRGELSFSEKASNAAALGAAAVVICNNADESFGMDLTDYKYSVPCVSIMKSDGAAVKAASTEQTTADGLTYYTGKINIYGSLAGIEYNSEYYTMSEFSSWGVPGSLELKPEITAPGGMIWSVNGVDPSAKAYEIMSGTSMAAPQVTGMAALVAEYIKANDLDRQTGMSIRQLAQSLLMSTAVPMRSKESGGQYYSVFQQGAGLGRVDLATTAESYITVWGQPDGKVKVELGDDPDREGRYYFSFSINNLNGEAMTYKLSADMFTQDLFGDNYGNLYLSTWTKMLPAEAKFSADGVSLESASEGYECDLNGDGITNAADAEHLLYYLLGETEELHADGDVDGDGSITTYDAHVLLTKLSGVYSVEVPADGSVEVYVELSLTEAAKEYLGTYYPTGAYMEAYVYASPVTGSEGKLGVTHSIPVLGYYGSWTEPSMYDVGSYLEYAYGLENRAPYLYQINDIRSNYVTIDYGDGTEYLFGGNPFTEEDTYLPERNAFNNRNGAILQNLRFTQIRNADNSMLLIENADTGERIVEEELGTSDGAYFHVNQGQWQNTMYRLPLGVGFQGMPEGTRLNISLITAPEYYTWYDAEDEITYTDWESLAEGAYLTTTLTIDNTAPVLKNVELGENNTLKITAQDNEYIAAVALLNATGTSMMASAPANQTEKGVEMEIDLDLSYVFGEKFLVAVFDYAENQVVYEIELELDNERPYFTAIDCTNINGDNSVNYVGMEANGIVVNLAANTGRGIARVAEFVEGAVFEINNDNELYVARNDDLFDFTFLAQLDPTGEHQLLGFSDIAYNKADGKLYGLFYSEKNNENVPFLCTIDLFSGDLTVLGEMPIDANTIAIDGAGNFYSTIYNESKFYTYTADVTETGNAKFVGQPGGYMTDNINSMAWDHNTDELYWAVNDGKTTKLLKVDPKTAVTELVHEYDFVAVGLYIACEAESDLFAPTDQVLSVTLPETAATLTGQSFRLTAQVKPWNVTDGSVTWSSDNTAVATVDDSGEVTGVAKGTAVITAASVLDPTKTASCTVTVSELGVELKGLVWDEEGQVHWASFNTDRLPEYKSLKALDPNLPVNATLVANGQLYASTLDTSAGISELYAVDPETFAMTKIGPSSIAYMDMAYVPSMGYGLAVYFNYIVLVDLETGEYAGAWDWTQGVASDLVGITYYGSQYNSNYNANMDFFLVLDSEGNVYQEAFLKSGSQIGNFFGPQKGFIRNIGKPVDYSYFQSFYFDGEMTYWTRFNEADNVVELIAWDCEETDNVYSIGYFGDGVWPVAGLYSDAEFAAVNALMDEEMTTASFRNDEMMTTVPTVELASARGSLDAVQNTAPVAGPNSSVANDPDYEEIGVTVTVPEEATNGIVTIEYDAGKLVCSGYQPVADAVAMVDDYNGTVTIAFADKTGIPADGAVAEVYFYSPANAADTTGFTVTFSELNQDTDYFHEEVLDAEIIHYCPSEQFVDVSEDSWFHEAVDYVVEMGYMNGMNTTHFGPGATMNRAQFVTVLYRMLGEPEVENTGLFTDVPANVFYTDAVYWALEAGITTGATKNTFNPNGQLTRTELVTFMYRFAKYVGIDAENTGDLSAYRDADQVLPFAVEPWKWAVSNGIVSGVTSNTLAPMALTNRAQAATIFQRFDNTFEDWYLNWFLNQI